MTDKKKVLVAYSNLSCEKCGKHIEVYSEAIKVKEKGKRAEYYHDGCMVK